MKRALLKKGLNVSAKSSGSDQPAHFAQADLGGNFLLLVHDLLVLVSCITESHYATCCQSLSDFISSACG